MYQAKLSESYFAAQTDDVIEQTTVGEVLRAAAARTPDAIALQEADIEGVLRRCWTYGELLADAERLAVALSTRYAPGERVCIWAPNYPEWVIIEFGAALAGLTLVTANPAYQPRELKYVLEQSRSVGLLMVPSYRGNPMAEIAAQVAAELPDLREVVDITVADELYAHGARPAELPTVVPTDPVQIQYTSGTTGFPKGAVLPHLGLVNNSRLTFERAKVARGGTSLVYMPMFHTAGCSISLLGSVQFGCRTILSALFDPPKMTAIIETEKVEMIFGVPTMFVAILESLATTPRDVSSLQVAISGGSMVPPELIRRVKTTFGCQFSTVYGQTESSPVLTQTRPDDPFEDLCETVGQALPQTEISIRDPATNLAVPVGVIGEICARGYCLMVEYNDNPTATAAAIDAQGWLHTGDLGTMDDRGFVRVTGRVKDMIIRGGENLFPAEIENILLEHPDVAEVAVVGVPDEKWGEIVVCFVRSSAGAVMDVGALRAHCRANLSGPKTPAHWISLEAWPLTGSGKIQKFVLRDRYVAGEWA